MDLQWDAAGLVTVVVQDRHSGLVRMVAHANREALDRTIATGQAYFFSRSRSALWKKGETSGHSFSVTEIWRDCDGDVLIYLTEQDEPACHTGGTTCFAERWSAKEQAFAEGGPDAYAAPTTDRLDRTIDARRGASAEQSYTQSLLAGGAGRIGAKLTEEASELGRAVAAETPDRVVAEAADLMFHTAVALAARGKTMRDALVELTRREGVGGHKEKAGRG